MVFLRIKRKKQTIFIEIQPNDTFLNAKEQLSKIFSISPQNIQLWYGQSAKDAKELSDVATLLDQGIEHDEIIYMCWKKEQSDQWEDLNQIITTETRENENNASK